MKCLLAVLGTHGDVLPFIALGNALAGRGHEVLLTAPAPFKAAARRAGLTFHPLGTRADFEQLVGEPDLWHPRKGAATAFRHALRFTPDVYRWIEAHRTGGRGPGGCIAVASSSMFGARIAQDRLGIPLVTLHVLPMLIESRFAPPRLPGLPLPEFLPARFRHWMGRGAYEYALEPSVLPGLNALRAGLGLPPVRRLAHWWNSPTAMLLMFPGWFAPPQPDWPPQAVQLDFPVADGFGDAGELDRDLAAFLDAGPPPLAFTYGSGMRQARRFFDTALALCARLGRRGVLLAPQDGQIPASLPAEIIQRPYAPLGALLPRSTALIHHGGIGTVAQALAAGVPQLIVPYAFNHFDDGLRIRQKHLGTVLSRRRFTPAVAARVLDRMLADPRVIHACGLAKERMIGERRARGGDGIDGACDAVEALAEPVSQPVSQPMTGSMMGLSTEPLPGLSRAA